MAFEEHVAMPRKCAAPRCRRSGTRSRSLYFRTRPRSSADAAGSRIMRGRGADYEKKGGLECVRVIGAEEDRRLHGAQRWSGARSTAPRDCASGLGPAKGKDFATSIGPDRRYAACRGERGGEMSLASGENAQRQPARLVPRLGATCSLRRTPHDMWPGDDHRSGTVGQRRHL